VGHHREIAEAATLTLPTPPTILRKTLLVELALSVAEFCRYGWRDFQNVGSVIGRRPIIRPIQLDRGIFRRWLKIDPGWINI
jgi:hypothetical protein